MYSAASRSTQDRPALQGGFDYAHESGLYAGIWGTNVSSKAINGASLELDLYGRLCRVVSATGASMSACCGSTIPKTPSCRARTKNTTRWNCMAPSAGKSLTLKYSRTLTNFFGYDSASMGTGKGNSHGSGYLELNADVPLPWDVTLGAARGPPMGAQLRRFQLYGLARRASKTFGEGWIVSFAYAGTNADRALWVVDGKKIGTAHWILGLKKIF
ncbi:TorF family putative porin [Cupriavidus basilensis]